MQMRASYFPLLFVGGGDSESQRSCIAKKWQYMERNGKKLLCGVTLYAQCTKTVLEEIKEEIRMRNIKTMNIKRSLKFNLT